MLQRGQSKRISLSRPPNLVFHFQLMGHWAQFRVSVPLPVICTPNEHGRELIPLWIHSQPCLGPDTLSRLELFSCPPLPSSAYGGPVFQERV
jgi:hypothetical protein